MDQRKQDGGLRGGGGGLVPFRVPPAPQIDELVGRLDVAALRIVRLRAPRVFQVLAEYAGSGELPFVDASDFIRLADNLRVRLDPVIQAAREIRAARSYSNRKKRPLGPIPMGQAQRFA